MSWGTCSVYDIQAMPRRHLLFRPAPVHSCVPAAFRTTIPRSIVRRTRKISLIHSSPLLLSSVVQARTVTTAPSAGPVLSTFTRHPVLSCHDVWMPGTRAGVLVGYGSQTVQARLHRLWRSSLRSLIEFVVEGN